MDGMFLGAPQKESRDSFEYKLSHHLGVSFMDSRRGEFIPAISFWTSSNLIRSMDNLKNEIIIQLCNFASPVPLRRAIMLCV